MLRLTRQVQVLQGVWEEKKKEIQMDILLAVLEGMVLVLSFGIGFAIGCKIGRWLFGWKE